MGEKYPLQVGDVIRSEKFASGFLINGSDGSEVWIEGQNSTHLFDSNLRLSYNLSRAEADFVVEEFWVLPQVGNGNYFYVSARRLAIGRVYDPGAELIRFYMQANITFNVEKEDIRVVGKMKRIFVKT